ncbi:MAG: hypothetical protein Q9226_004356, partial [Calogaya cf. arnoldii]
MNGELDLRDFPLDKSLLPSPEITSSVSDTEDPSPTSPRASRLHSGVFPLSERVPPSSKDSKCQTPLADQRSFVPPVNISAISTSHSSADDPDRYFNTRPPADTGKG